MPRNSPRTSSRSRQNTQPASIQEDSLDEDSLSPSKNRRRSPRNLDTSFRPSASGSAAARVTRSLTRGSKGEPEARDVDTDEDESESEPEVIPRKRNRSARKSTPKKKGRASKGTQGKAGKKRGRPSRKTRKQETEDEESDESLDLGESEEDEEKEKVDDEEDEEDVKPEATPATRRGSRGGTRSSSTSGATTNISPSSKTTPSVVLERVENVTPSSGRPTRGRSVKQRKESTSEEGAEPAEDDDEEEAEEEQTPASRTSRARRAPNKRGRPSLRQQQQQPAAKKTRQQQPAKSEKMVPSEENAAALTTSETVAKEEKAGGEKDEAPLKKETTEKKGAGDQDEEPKEQEEDEKMEVDEPAVQSTDEISEVESEPTTETSSKHKLDESKDEDASESAPAQKKSKTEDESKSDDEEVESKTEAKETKTTVDSAGDSKVKTDATATTENEPKEKAAAEAPEKSEKNSTFQESDKKVAEETAPAKASVTNGEESDKKSEVPAAAPVESRVNGSASDDVATSNETTDNGCDLESSIIFASLGVKVPRRCVPNTELNDKVGKDPFTVVSFNLAEEDWTAKHQNLVNEVLQLSPSILCLQEIDEVYFKSSLDSALKSHGYMGLYKAGKTSTKGLATFYLLSSFEILHHREFEVQELLEKDVENKNLVDAEKEALKSFLHSPAPVLITKMKSISNGKTVTVGNVHLPTEDEIVLAVQVAAVLREIHNISEGTNNPHVLCGSFNLADDSVVYQLLRDGILKNEILDELKKNANVPVPEKENASLAKLLETCLQHPSSSLKSSYGSILGHELKFPDKAQKLSKDSLWFSSDSLLAKSILDVGAIAEKTLPNTHISLKAELGFVN